MTPRNHVLIVEGRTIRPLVRRDMVVATSIEADTISIELREPADWAGLALHVTFASGCANPIRVAWDGKSAIAVPWECCTDAGNMLVTLVGLGDDGSIRAITGRMGDPLIVAAPGMDTSELPASPTENEYAARVLAAQKAAEDARKATADIIAAREAGEFDGADGASPEVTATKEGAVATISVSNADGTSYEVSVSDGARGEKGDKGDPGTAANVGLSYDAAARELSVADGGARSAELPLAGEEAGLMSPADRAKLDGVEAGATATTVDAALSAGGANPVAGGAIAEALAAKVDAEAGKGLSANDLTDALLALVEGAVQRALVGAAGGVASLGADGRVPSAQLPGYVDDVLEFASLADFPAEGEGGKIYVALDTGRLYRWGGTAYAEVSESLALGTTQGTAYPGELGAAHAAARDNPHQVTKAQVGLGEADNTADADKRVAYAADAGTVGGHTVGADVPAGAVFTDTIYEDATAQDHGLMSAADKARLDATPPVEVVSELPASPVEGTVYVVVEAS